MKISRTQAIGITVLGLGLLIAGPLLPGAERITRLGPPSRGHVTDLAPGGDGSFLAGTQQGQLWRLRGGEWTTVRIDLGGQPVTALPAEPAGDPAAGPIGTAAGLVNPPPGMPALDTRISDELATAGGLVVGTGEGLQIQGAGAWQPALPGVNIYRLEPQRVGDTDFVHAGTIGDGVYSARVDDLSYWQPNRTGLPDDAYVFTFAVTRGGRLLAGTNLGLYWQAAPLEPWTPLKVGLERSRILSMLRTDAAGGDAQRLWIGSDAGLQRVDLREDAGGVEALSYAELISAPPDHVRYGISWILPYEDGVLFSAGSVYRFGPAGMSGWYWISLAGVLLILLGGWLFPGRPGSTPARGSVEA